MTVLELTIGRVFLLIEIITKFFLEKPLPLLKSAFLTLILFFCFFLIFIWIRYELKNRDEIDKWKFYLDSIIKYFFQSKPKKRFEEIKKTFYEDKILALKEINKFLEFVLETFGYQGTIEEKLSKVNQEFLKNLEDVKKTIQIFKLIEEKKQRGEEIKLSEEEFLLIFHEYEKALYHLNVITKEDFLASNLS